ncbi:class I SAM-dependent methyltransferase [Leptospira ellisii]|uniref:Class I SAM-dependent methyltransferase n=1 Tax=Leptospira ellisii TaxID=2023197 RepID=A0A2N0B587_9LEPT|nr:class I SAM-dependent methyltransferase [Leptospira ellisii]MDV6236876.1 class I SAM-dependent methyltransferase [Leptospira ellisii]PJZ91638.1 hypothetical protein CH379_17560 [Leptospira ellisii]PKA05201.1 hypothetical protein CH375_06485 [Leptospira ellisii]
MRLLKRIIFALYSRISNLIRNGYLRSIDFKIQTSISVYYRIIGYWEKMNRVDFYSKMTLEDLGLNAEEARHYGGSRSYELAKVVKRLNLPSDSSVLDFGCGKGAALYAFSKFPFKGICGIELSDIAYEIAVENVKNLSLEKRIQVILGDARSLKKELDSFNVFYFYNPFPPDVMKTVVQNVIDSLKNKNRDGYLIYNYPIDSVVIENFNQIKFMFQYVPFFFGGAIKVYKYNKV